MLCPTPLLKIKVPRTYNVQTSKGIQQGKKYWETLLKMCATPLLNIKVSRVYNLQKRTRFITEKSSDREHCRGKLKARLGKQQRSDVQLSERLSPLGIMGDQLWPPLYITALSYRGVPSIFPSLFLETLASRTANVGFCSQG